MKKIISLALTVIMMVSILSIGTSAAGTLVFNDNFDTGFASRNWVNNPPACEFKWDGDNGCIHGYSNAAVLQSNYDEKYNKRWGEAYFNMDVQIRGFDNLEDEEVGEHGVTMWYKDFIAEECEITYTFNITVETGEAKIHKSGEYKYKDEYGITQTANVNATIATGKIDGTIEVGENAPWFKMGLRVENGSIIGYYNEKEVCKSLSSDSTGKIGPVSVDAVDDSLGTNTSMFLMWNHGGNWLAFDNFEVWTPDYDFVADINYGDVNSDGKINMIDASLMLQKLAGWTVDGFVDAPADANGDGKFNLHDVTRLLQYIAEWDVVLGPEA